MGPQYDLSLETSFSDLFKSYSPPLDIAAVTLLVRREYNVTATLGNKRRKIDFHATSIGLTKFDLFKS